MSGFDRGHVARGFDRLAPIYDLAGRVLFGGALRRSAALLLDDVPRDARALVIGAGTGAVLVDLRRAGHRGEIVALDLSPGMTRRARARLDAEEATLAGTGRVRFVVGGIPLEGEEAALAGPFDLVLTPFVLDVLDPAALRAAVRGLVERLAPGGRWIVADFAPPRGPARRAAVAALYVFFRATCGIPARALPPIGGVLTGAGLVRERLAPCARGWFVAESWARGEVFERAGGLPRGAPGADEVRAELRR